MLIRTNGNCLNWDVVAYLPRYVLTAAWKNCAGLWTVKTRIWTIALAKATLSVISLQKPWTKKGRS